MPELEIIPHPDEQRSYAELRSEFRSEALANLRAQFSGTHPLGWNMIGDSTTARDKYSADDWAYEMLCRLDGHVQQDFGLREVKLTWSARLEKEAQAALLHESATWDDSVSGVTDHDAPACPPVELMTDDQICDYVNKSIEDSDRG